MDIFYKLLFTLSLARVFSYQHEIAIASVFKDEAPWLKEWIEYHKLLGVTHFRLYNNESSDDYLAVLDPYLKNQEVEVIDWPKGKYDHLNWAVYRQWPACKDAINHLRSVSKWVALIDIDEFILPLEEDNLPDFLKRYEDVCGIVLSWQCFGTSYVHQIPQNRLMIEMLVRKAEEHSFRNLPVKSIVRADLVDLSKRGWPPHTVRYKLGKKVVFPNRVEREETLDISLWEIHPEIAVINHYVHRTEDFFRNKKMQKKQSPRIWKNLMSEEGFLKWYNDCNQEIDTRIFRFIPKLKEKMGFIDE